jgi:hypothetical protein
MAATNWQLKAIKDGPRTESGDYQKQKSFWTMVDTIQGGAEAMRKAGEMYLPRFEKETMKDYSIRLSWTPFTNIYGDISRNLASRPFAKRLVVSDGSPEAIAGTVDPASESRAGGFVDDVDGRGNDLHTFSQNVFQQAIDDGLTWILVDYSKANDSLGDKDGERSVAEERAMGLRPFWVHLPALSVIAAYSDFENGVEVLTHVRIDETTSIRDGFKENSVERVRVIDREEVAPGVFGPALWTLYEKQTDTTTGKSSWNIIDNGVYTIGVIPMVCFFTGERQTGTFIVKPPLRDLAYMQVEEYQQESNLKSVKALTAFPMLVGEGIPTHDQDGKEIRIPVGPRAVLLAPPTNSGSGSFKFIEPSATSLTFLEGSLAKHRQEMRDLGMQPVTATNITVITAANVSQKASSAVQAWAIMFRDALERAFDMTHQWLGLAGETKVNVHTDFAIDHQDGSVPSELLKAQAQGVLSKRTVQEEFKRRNMVSDDFSAEAEALRLAEEEQGLDPEYAINPITGERVEPTTRPLVVAKPNPAQAIAASQKDAGSVESE